MRIACFVAMLMAVSTVCDAGEHYRSLTARYVQDNKHVEIIGDKSDLIDFLQIVCTEQVKADCEYWDRSEADHDWMHDRQLYGWRKRFIKCANDVYDGSPLRIDLEDVSGSNMRSIGFVRAVEIWRNNKAKPNFAGGKEDTRTITIVNPTPYIGKKKQ